MAGNDDLHPILSNIHETIGDVLKAIQELTGEVTKIQDAIIESAESIRDAIHENIQAQAELKMMEHVVEVRSILPQIEAENERIQVEQDELDAQLERIAERYEKKHEELDEKAASRIRDLGSHIFEIDEQEFEDGIESPFAEHVTTAWMSFQSHNDAVEKERREQVEETTGDVVTDIHEFVDQQNQLLDRIDNVHVDIGKSVPEPRRLQLPYYSVTVEIDGKTENHVVGPSVVDDTEEHGGVTLQPLPGVDDLISRTEMNDPRTETIGQENLGQVLEPTNNNKPGISYTAAVESAVPEQLTVQVEGGD